MALTPKEALTMPVSRKCL